MTLRGLLTFLGSIVATALGGLSPWIGPFFDLKLISDYFQPELNAVTSIVVVIAFIATYVIGHKNAQWKKKSQMIWCFAGSATLLFLCLILKWTIGVVWAPGVIMTIVVRTFWITIYLLLFTLLSVGLCNMVMLIPAKELKQDQLKEG